MAVEGNVALLAAQTWPQADIRSPLGIWGARATLTGTGDGGSVKANINTPTLQSAAYVYNCEALNISMDVLQVVSTFLKSRLLTNWPNVDAQAGVQGFSTLRITGVSGSVNFTAPVSGDGTGGGKIHEPGDRYVLMYDPRPSAALTNIIELEVSDNVLATNYFFEAYGYFWDRSVMDAPGGPRFPGAS